MSCSNCYNGCTEIVSDRCVKYTGIDIPILEIKNGDSLSYVEQALIQFLVSTLDGSGIKITLPQNIYCDLVKKYLPTCGDVTALTLFEALVKAACDLQLQIDTINTTLTTLNADYSVGCLSGVTSSSDTHDVVQAIITKLCQIDVSLTALSINVNTNYVKIADINTYIAAYIASTGTSTKYSNRMVPYTVVEFYPTPALMANFSASGAGIVGTDWEKIYLCNGNNGTPDKRGVVPVGATIGMGGGPLNTKVDPATPGGFNPTYTLGGPIQGDNSVTLTIGTLPSHTHVATVNLNDPGHTHEYDTVCCASGGGDSSRQSVPSTGTTKSSQTGITVSVTNAPEGGGLPHQNNQPALACYYIMYIP